MFRSIFFQSLFLLTVGLSVGHVHAGDTIVVPPNMFQVDHDLQLIVVNLPVDEVNAQWPNLKAAIHTDEIYALSADVQEITVGTAIAVANAAGEIYQLYFTALPLIAITTNQVIVDEPRVPGNFMISDTSGTVISAGLGIEFRGSFSQTYPKKSYRIEFWNDSTGMENVDLSLLGMRSDDDWNLQAMYNEPLRLRSVVCNKLWRMIHAPYYQTAEPNAVTGVAMEYAELFVNGSYQGIYALSERIDRKQLKLKKYNGSIRGQLYQGVSWGAPTFSFAPPYNDSLRSWSGFEYKYPTEVTEWFFLHEFVDFVINAPEGEFLAEYPSRFELGNAVDYFIFLNLLRATDNTGKNIYVALFDSGTPYFYVPHDLDGTFGVIWDGSQENSTNDLLMNGFYARLMEDCEPDGFRKRLQARWNALRTDILNSGQIEGMFDHAHALLTSNGAYEREALAWSEYSHDPGQLDYLSTWLTARISYLDSAFNIYCGPTSIGKQDFIVFSMYPNPTSDQVEIVLGGARSTADLHVLDATGRTVMKQALHRARTVVDLRRLRPGIYLVQLESGNHTTTMRLVIN